MFRTEQILAEGQQRTPVSMQHTPRTSCLICLACCEHHVENNPAHTPCLHPHCFVWCHRCDQVLLIERCRHKSTASREPCTLKQGSNNHRLMLRHQLLLTLSTKGIYISQLNCMTYQACPTCTYVHGYPSAICIGNRAAVVGKRWC